MQETSQRKAIPVGTKRWLYVVNGMVLLLFLGLIYAWSIFVAPLEQEFGWLRSETSLAFSICMSMFCIGGFAAGMLSKRFPSRVAVWLCAALVFTGFLLAARVHTLTGLYISYGVLVGFGIGLSYNAIISTVIQWFPDKPGLISGLLLMGFGFGGMLLGSVSRSLITLLGWRTTFNVLGIAFGAIILFCSLFLVPPGKDVVLPQPKIKPGKTRETGLELSTGEMLRRPSFYLYFLWAVLLTAAGLMLIGHASPMALDMGLVSATAAFLVGIISIFNGAGRVISGFALDTIGRKQVMFIVSGWFILSGAILMLALKTGSMPLLTLGFVFTGLSYGSIPPTNSMVIRTFFGTRDYAVNFSVVNLNIIFSSFSGPYLAGILQTSTGSYFATALVMLLFGAAALLLAALVRKP